MATARSTLIDAETPMAYHLMTRCVRRAFLCGRDKVTGRNLNHRKQWIIDRLKFLAPNFALDIYGYSIMSNHFHLVVYYDPKACRYWSADEVAERWYNACPPKKRNGEIDEVARAIKRATMVNNPNELEEARNKLGSISTFMKLLKWPIAKKINEEDGVTGHAFEQRFYSGALLSEKAMLAAMAYVDLNPVRAKLARQVKQIKNSAITERFRKLENSTKRIEEFLGDYLEPLMGGLGNGRPKSRPFRPSMKLKSYIDHLEAVIRYETQPKKHHQEDKWIMSVASMSQRQRAYGNADQLRKWLNNRNLAFRETALPN